MALTHPLDHGPGRSDCAAAWKKDPLSGVIGA
jgi:hypothetical protein